MKYSLENIYTLLQEKEYKLTPQRKIILKALLDNEDEHLSAEDVYQKVKLNFPEIGLATVYRTLELLADIDILQKMNFDDGKIRYEFADHDEHHHHHLICLGCAKVIEYNDDLLDTLEDAIFNKTQFKVLDHKLKFYGYCKNCNNKS